MDKQSHVNFGCEERVKTKSVVESKVKHHFQ